VEQRTHTRPPSTASQAEYASSVLVTRSTNSPGEPASSKSPQLLDIAGLANQLGVTERFVRRLIAQRRVSFYKIGKFIRFDPIEIENWIDQRRVNAIEPH
jgi:excisionase family DNA binding protein